ncbi:MAG: RNA polymerase sigma factor [Patescibacteria group bacterium]|nr:RNA polymerase sigma factor [Patescibacteria group bacterium]
MKKRFSERYEADADAIFRFCVIRVSDREQALDITQETFTRYWKSLAGGEEISNERAFLFTVAYRLIVDWYRKKRAEPMSSMDDDNTGEAFDPIDERTAESMGMGAEGRFLVDAISKLAPSNRDAVYLRFVEGLSPPEIGKALGISSGAASVRVSRGLVELRKITGYDDIDGEDTGTDSKSMD